MSMHQVRPGLSGGHVPTGPCICRLTSDSVSSDNSGMLRWLITVSCVVAWFPVPAVSAPVEQTSEADREEIRANRFLDLLKRRPGFGTALDRVTRFHMERGTLDKLVAQLSSVRSSQPDSLAQQLIAGMLQIQRGDGSAAVPLLSEVEQQRPADPVVSLTLGLALRDAGQVPGAIAALERALKKRPIKRDMRSICENLARLHGRAGNSERSLEVWQRLELQFPHDRIIREDVAARLQAEGHLQPALERWQHLAASSTNPEQRTQYRLSAADIQLRLGQEGKAQRTLEDELDQIRPGSWMHEVVRTKVESVLLSSQGRHGIIAYYRSRLSGRPHDIASVGRLAALLAEQGEFAEASALYRRAIERMPSSVKLRTALIRLLASQGNFSAAVAAGRELLEINDVGTDEFELVGQLLLHDSTLEKSQREHSASRVWMRICGDLQDAGTLGYTARLHRRFGLPDRAVELFRSVTQLEPENSVWREELGETLFELGRRDEAVREWGYIAEGSRRNTQNLTRLSEILEQAGEFGAALKTMQQACELNPEISDHVRLARLLRQVEQLDACYAQLELAAESATSIGDRRIINEAAAKAWNADPALYVRTAHLQKKLEQNNGSSDEWLQLALMYQADQRIADAVRFTEMATVVDPHSVLAWEVAADLCFHAGLLDRASNASRRLAELSPQNRTAALQQVVRLEQQLGRTAKALEAAELLIRESPEHADSCRVFADLCFESGRDAEGLECLKQCVRRSPDDVQLSMELADILADQFQPEAASSVLWRTFERVENLSDRLALIEPLTRFAQETDTVDQVIDRLKSADSTDPVDRCLFAATAISLCGEPDRARELLDQATYQFGRDVRILKVLVELAETDGDLELATRYQRQVTDISNTSEDRVRLAGLEFKTGQMSETELLWIRDARSGNDTRAAIRSIDRFLDAGRVEAAEFIGERLAAERPGDWRLLYRLAVIQWRMNRRENAVDTFGRLVALDRPADHVFAEPQTEDVRPLQNVTVRSRSDSLQADRPPLICPLMRRLNQNQEALNWLQLYTGDELWSERLSVPADYGAARSAALGFLWLAKDPTDRAKMLDSVMSATNVNHTDVTDWCAIAVMARRSNAAEAARLDDLKAVLDESDSTEHQLVLAGLLCRRGAFGSPKNQTGTDSDSDAVMLLTAAELVAAREPEWLADIGGWTAVHKQLQRNNQTHYCSEVIAKLSLSSRPETLISAAELAIAHGDVDAACRCIRKTLALRSQTGLTPSNVDSRLPQLSSMAVQLTTEEDWEPVRQLVDLLLEIHAARYRPLRTAGAERELTTAVRYRLLAGNETTADGLQHSTSTDAFEFPNPGRHRLGKTRSGSGSNRGSQRSGILNAEDLGGHLDPYLFFLLAQITPEENDPHGHAGRLVNHLASISHEASVPRWISASIVLTQFYARYESVDDAMLTLIPVIEYLPEDVGIRMIVAKYLNHVGARREALDMLDQLSVLRDRQHIVQTERFALQLCVILGDQNRARRAATRLLALKLDHHDVQFITEQLMALQLPETAHRFQSRIVQPPAGRTEHLHQLMQNYFSDGNTSAAVRIARQFILQPSITMNGASVIRSVQTRRDALQILAAADAIKPMILQLRRQRDHDAVSFHQHHVLVELLKADGRNSEAAEAARPLGLSLVADPDAGIQLARQLERQGRLESACDVCQYLLEADTRLFHRDYYRFIRLFERNGRLAELADLLLSTSLKDEANGHWGVQQLTERLLLQDEARGLKLFSTAWEAWPHSRSALLANVSHEAIWLLPEVFDFSSTRILPSDNRRVDRWSGVAEHFRVRGRGTVTGTLSQMLQVPVAGQRAAEFLNEIRAALTRQPDWHAGKIYAALLEAHLGHTDTALELIADILQHHLAKMPPTVAWITACELRNVNTRPLDRIVVRLLEHLSTLQRSGAVLLKSGTVWHAAPDYLLLQHYAADGDADAARSVVDRLVKRIQGESGTSTLQTGSHMSADVDGNSKIQEAFSDLARQLHPYLPAEAERVRDLRCTVPWSSTDQEIPQSTFRTARTEQVIQAIREQLLTQRP